MSLKLPLEVGKYPDVGVKKSLKMAVEELRSFPVPFSVDAIKRGYFLQQFLELSESAIPDKEL